jgi:hypothetical protein
MNRTFLIGILLAFAGIVKVSAQTNEEENSLVYRGEVFATAASDHTPFWLVSNRYSLVPLETGNGYVRAGLFYNHTFGKGFRWEAGFDIAAITPRYRNVMVQQAYAELGYKSLLLTVGSKEQYNSLWNEQLSSGDLVLSTNARPIPEIKLSMPSYTVIPLTKGWLQLKGDFSVGRSFDNAYLESFVNNRQTYIKDVLWHHKSLYFNIKNTQNHFPLSLELGLQHGAQWGGTSTNPSIGKQPQSLSDFVRVVFGMSGGEGSTASDSINVLGNEYGSYDFRLSFTKSNWVAHAYHQHYFEDKSGTELKNGFDGLWGFQLDLPEFSWLQMIVVELLETRNQTGAFHFIDFDHKAHPGIGGGADNYYNNGGYPTGLSYFNRALGSPLITSPEYNKDGSLGFKNNRTRNLHFGLSGNLSTQVGYRLLFTSMEGWGTTYRPFLNKKEGLSGLCEITYQHPKLHGWVFTGMLSVDKGDYYTKGIGGGLRIMKRGILPINRKQ